MKKMMMMAAMLVAVLSANAQNEIGQITVKPMVGVNLSTITDEKDSETKTGLTIGAEAEYGFTEKIGFSAGLLYSQQGCKFDGDDDEEKLDYINIPVLANYYVMPGLAIKAGIQPGFLMSAKDENSKSFKDHCKSFAFSIPIGASYEIQNFVVDARYNLGLTKINKRGDKSHKNSLFSITVGYKFAL